MIRKKRAALSLATKYVIRYRGTHVFNPSNIGLVVAFLVLGSERVEPLDFWWAPLDLDMLRASARLGAEYVGEDSARHTPVMLHRAIVGSLERFIGVLIEHHAGNFPAWLAPVQAVVMNITDAQADAVAAAVQTLVAQGFRVEADLRNEKIGYKIREHTLQKVPYLLVIGDREKENGAVSVRIRSGEDLGSMTVEQFAERLKGEQIGG